MKQIKYKLLESNISKYYFLRIAKHLFPLIILWLPLFYFMYSYFNNSIANVFNIILLIFLLIYQSYNHRYGLKGIYIEDEMVTFKYYKYNKLKIVVCSIYSTNLVYTETGVTVMKGKLSVYKEEDLLFFQTNGLDFSKERLKKCTSDFEYILNQIRFKRTEIGID